MSKYIDADELVKALNDKEVDYRADIDEVIRTTPTADVEQVVRCKDCKWYDPPHIAYNHGGRKDFYDENEIEYVTADIGSNVGGTCMGHKTYCTAHNREDAEDYEEIIVFREPDDFCSYGERKSDE